MVWGGVILSFAILNGVSLGDGAYAVGQILGLIFAALLFFVGIYYLFRDADPELSKLPTRPTPKAQLAGYCEFTPAEKVCWRRAWTWLVFAVFANSGMFLGVIYQLSQAAMSTGDFGAVCGTAFLLLFYIPPVMLIFIAADQLCRIGSRRVVIIGRYMAILVAMLQFAAAAFVGITVYVALVNRRDVAAVDFVSLPLFVVAAVVNLVAASLTASAVAIPRMHELFTRSVHDGRIPGTGLPYLRIGIYAISLGASVLTALYLISLILHPSGSAGGRP